MKKILTQAVVFIGVLLLVVACASDKKPAEQAIKAAEDALNGIRGEAAKYVPDQLKGLDDTLKAAKDSFAKGDYKAALSSVKDVAAKAKDLKAAAEAKKAALTKSWDEMSAGLPKMVEAIKSRVDILSKSKKLPAGLDRAKFDGAKASLSEITEMWTQAGDASKAGNLAEAVAKAKTIKDKAVEIMTTLGMQVPAGAKS